MADVVRQSQQLRAKQQEALSGQPINLFSDNARIFNREGYSVERRTETLGNASFGSSVNYTFPKGFIGGAHLEVTLAAPASGNYTNLVGLSVVDQLTVKGGEDLTQFGHRQVLRHMFQKIEKNDQDLLIQSVGGASGFNAGTVACPLMLPWSAWSTGLKYVPVPIDNRGDSALRLDLAFTAGDDLLDAGASTASLTKVDIVYYVYTPDDSMMPQIPVYHGVGFQTVRSAPIATGVLSNIDVRSFTQIISEMGVQCSLVSDWTTAHDYFVDQEDLSTLRLQINGSEYWKMTSKNGLLLDSIVLGGLKESAYGNELMIPFGGAGDSGHHHLGGLDAGELQSFKVELTHVAGADAYIDVVAECNQTFKVEGGAWRKC